MSLMGGKRLINPGGKTVSASYSNFFVIKKKVINE